MSSLVVVITFAHITSAEGGGATAAVPWKEEGEVPAWSDGPGPPFNHSSITTWLPNLNVLGGG